MIIFWYGRQAIVFVNEGVYGEKVTKLTVYKHYRGI